MHTTFDGNASANELGVHRFVTGWVQGFPAVDGPWPVEYVKEVHEFDPSFRLLWVVNVWKTPNDGIVKTGGFMIARQVRNPVNTRDWIKHPRLSSHSVHGVKYQAPLLSADILDGLEDKDRQKGALPRFEPFTGRHVNTMRAALWFRNNKDTDRAERERLELAAKAEFEADKKFKAEKAYERKNDALWRNTKQGAAVYVSESLQKLRESAGFKVEAA